MNDMSKVLAGIDKSDFHDAFDKFKRNIVLSVLNSDVHYYQYLNKDQLIGGNIGVLSRCPDNLKDQIKKIINDGNEFRVSVITTLYHYFK